MSEKAMKIDPIILIQKIIRENTYLTEIDNKLDIDDFHNPLNVEETQSQLVDSIFGSCNIKSQKGYQFIYMSVASKMISSSGNAKATSIQPYGSLFKSGVSNYTVSDEDEIQKDFIEIKDGKQYNSQIEIDDVHNLKPPELKNQKYQMTYEELNQRCQQLEQNLEVERKKNVELNDIILCQNEKIQELTEIEKAAYEQMDSRLKEISELSAKNIYLEAQLQELRERQEKELSKNDYNQFRNQNKRTCGFQQQFTNECNAMYFSVFLYLEIKEKQIQLLQGQLSSLRAATQYRSQGSYHSAQSHDNIQDNQVVNHIINNTNNNQIIIKNEIFQKGMTSLVQQPKTSTPKKQQFINQDSQSTQRSKKSVNHNKQSSKDTITQPPTSWLDHLQKKNDDKLKVLKNQPSEKEFQQAYLNNSINDNVNKYMHADLKITKVNSPAFQRKTTYQLTQDNDNQDNKDFVKQKSFQHK
ncbi:unnamed protein product (macronuclear) [Paramecium tetraurelia]|uniref:Uncharacterized protein n=1 Tax=Paramecium tetraurelia TaxID=5888 RepID=A0EBZ6_PARTE|nr:uncharacterized protein GSPATT00025549001 [Paramecium tetraurelia]CAK92813.1 unnamed protein product [Paramecium tetraurelia]|eukprot:XP_001460210.1 hypothetical protein (macronuclear) [Paramecium tetraurelia strain d4-2]